MAQALSIDFAELLFKQRPIVRTPMNILDLTDEQIVSAAKERLAQRKSELFALVRYWYNGPAWEGVHLADFCTQHGIPIKGRDELSDEVKEALAKCVHM